MYYKILSYNSFFSDQKFYSPIHTPITTPTGTPHTSAPNSPDRSPLDIEIESISSLDDNIPDGFSTNDTYPLQFETFNSTHIFHNHLYTSNPSSELNTPYNTPYNSPYNSPYNTPVKTTKKLPTIVKAPLPPYQSKSHLNTKKDTSPLLTQSKIHQSITNQPKTLPPLSELDLDIFISSEKIKEIKEGIAFIKEHYQDTDQSRKNTNIFSAFDNSDSDNDTDAEVNDPFIKKLSSLKKSLISEEKILRLKHHFKTIFPKSTKTPEYIKEYTALNQYQNSYKLIDLVTDLSSTLKIKSISQNAFTSILRIPLKRIYIQTLKKVSKKRSQWHLTFAPISYPKKRFTISFTSDFSTKNELKKYLSLNNYTQKLSICLKLNKHNQTIMHKSRID